MKRMLLLTASTARIEAQVELFGILGTIFLVVAVLFLIISVTLFFALDIRTVIGEKTGRIARKSIEEMERSNAQSGKLLSKNSRKSRKGENAGIQTGQMKAVNELFDAAGAATGPLQSVIQPPPAVSPAMDVGSDATSILDDGGNATTVLDTGVGGTTVLQGNRTEAVVHYEGPDDAPTAMLEEDRRTSIGKFLLIKNIMLIHTDEYIER